MQSRIQTELDLTKRLFTRGGGGLEPKDTSGTFGNDTVGSEVPYISSQEMFVAFLESVLKRFR